MSRLSELWFAGSATRRTVLVVGIAVIATFVIVASYVLLRPEYAVLFRNLKPADAQTIVAELDKLKVPYRFDEGGATVLVQKSAVDGLRLKLMSTDLPLKGTVGLELFNNSDLGLTEFSQKVNFQRALQGELVRTISSLEEIESARVHLSFPDASLFQRGDTKAKASVVLFMRGGKTLTPATIHGIQRLVAAAVPNLDTNDVTVVDQQGTRVSAPTSDESMASDRKLMLKAALEQYYARKIASEIEPLVGVGNVTVNVDASLNLDENRVFQESTNSRSTPNYSKSPALPSGSLSANERAMMSAPPLPREQLDVPLTPVQTYKRVEQLVAAPGAVRKLTVAVLVAGNDANAQLTQIRELAAASAGIDSARGDVLSVVASHAGIGVTGKTRLDLPTPLVATEDGQANTALPPSNKAPKVDMTTSALVLPWSIVVAAGAAVVILLGLIIMLLRRTSRARLDESERAAYVTRLRDMLANERASHAR